MEELWNGSSIWGYEFVKIDPQYLNCFFYIESQETCVQHVWKCCHSCFYLKFLVYSSLKKVVKQSHTKNQWVSLFFCWLVKIVITHDLIVRMIGKRRIVDLVEKDDIKFIYLKIWMHQMFVKSLRQKAKYVIILEMFLPLNSSRIWAHFLLNLWLENLERVPHGLKLIKLICNLCRSIIILCYDRHLNFSLNILFE